MTSGETVVFVEVKARTSVAYGRPEEFVRRQKQEKIGKAALDFLKTHRLTHRPLRFDVVALGPQGITHLPNAFVPGAGTYTL
jgi:putative endonuclease